MATQAIADIIERVQLIYGVLANGYRDMAISNNNQSEVKKCRLRNDGTFFARTLVRNSYYTLPKCMTSKAN